MKKLYVKCPIEILCILLALILMLGGCTDSGESGSGAAAEWEQITMEEAVKVMGTEEGYIILDVRRADEYASGHIPGAVHLANEVIGEDDAAVEAVLPDKEQKILVYCRSGNRSKQAAQKLADMGYTQVVEFGGIQDWTGELEY